MASARLGQIIANSQFFYGKNSGITHEHFLPHLQQAAVQEKSEEEETKQYLLDNLGVESILCIADSLESRKAPTQVTAYLVAEGLMAGIMAIAKEEKV